MQETQNNELFSDISNEDSATINGGCGCGGYGRSVSYGYGGYRDGYGYGYGGYRGGYGYGRSVSYSYRRDRYRGGYGGCY